MAKAGRTQIQVTAVEINNEAVVIEGIDIDRIILAEDLYGELAEEPAVRYEFKRDGKGGAMKYLWKVVNSHKACSGQGSFGAKVEKLNGQFLTLADSFRVAV